MHKRLVQRQPSLFVALAPGALALLGQEDGLDVGQDAALGDGHAGQQLVQLLVIPARRKVSGGNDGS